MAQVGGGAAPEVLFVQGCNVTAVRLFEGLRTQWNTQIVAGLAGGGMIHTGLRYEVIDHVRRGLGIPDRDGDFIRLQIMEAEALIAFGEGRR
ncbi:MAG: DUF1799 domain-containing protein [Pseudomonadota bacterium]